MESLKRFYLRGAEAAIRETIWFRSAPAASRARATFKILGVEQREFQGMIARSLRPALRVECRCGDFVGTFSLLLQDLGEAVLIDERAMSETILVGDSCSEFN